MLSEVAANPYIHLYYFDYKKTNISAHQRQSTNIMSNLSSNSFVILLTYIYLPYWTMSETRCISLVPGKYGNNLNSLIVKFTSPLIIFPWCNFDLAKGLPSIIRRMASNKFCWHILTNFSNDLMLVIVCWFSSFGTILIFLGIFWRTHWRNRLQCGMLMYPDHLQA